MKRHTGVIASILFHGLSFCQQPGDSGQKGEPRTPTIEAEVVDGATGSPMPGRLIIFVQPNNEQRKTTGEDGRCKFQGPFSPGPFRLTTPAGDGYLFSSVRSDWVTGSAWKRVTVKIHRSGTISGHVLDSARRPVAGAAVH